MGCTAHGRPRIARRTHASVANTRWRSVSMNEYSPSTRSCSRSGGNRLARSMVGGHTRSMIAHASRKPSASAGSSLAAFRVAPVQLGLDERPDVDAVDPDVADLAVDVDIFTATRRAASRR